MISDWWHWEINPLICLSPFKTFHRHVRGWSLKAPIFCADQQSHWDMSGNSTVTSAQATYFNSALSTMGIICSSSSWFQNQELNSLKLRETYGYSSQEWNPSQLCGRQSAQLHPWSALRLSCPVHTHVAITWTHRCILHKAVFLPCLFLELKKCTGHVQRGGSRLWSVGWL